MWLHTSGTKILDERGVEVVFNGVSTMVVFGYEPPVFPAPSYPISKMDEVRSHGLNLIRLDVSMNTSLYGVPASQQTPTSLTFNPNFFPSLDLLVNECAKVGIWVNICFVTGGLAPMPGWGGTLQKGYGAGLPTWMYDGTWSYFTKQWNTGNYTPDPYGNSHAWRDFWNTDAASANYVPQSANLRTAYETWWRTVANHYKNSPNVIFGLWNEPQNTGGGDSVWGATGDTHTQQQGAAMYKGFVEHTVDVIRSVAPNNLIFINTAYFWDAFTTPKIDRPNVVVECHSYGGTTYNGYVDPSAFHGAAYPKYWDLGWRYNQPYIMGEFGGIEEGTLQNTADTQATVSEMTANRVSWSYLSFRPEANGDWAPWGTSCPHQPSGVCPVNVWATVLEPNLVPNIQYYTATTPPPPSSIVFTFTAPYQPSTTVQLGFTKT